MRFYNSEKKEIPILYFYGNSKKILSDIYSNVVKQKVKVPKDLTIITLCHDSIKNAASLTQQLQSSEVPFINAMEMVSEPNSSKASLALSALSGVKTDYVLLLDSQDIALTQSVNEILERFEACGKDILFGASKERMPNMYIEKIFNRDGLGAFNQLNTGICLGNLQAVKDYYQAAVDIVLLKNKFGDVKYMLRYAYDLFSNDVAFDYKCSCSQTLVGVSLTPIEDENSAFIVT